MPSSDAASGRRSSIYVIRFLTNSFIPWCGVLLFLAFILCAVFYTFYQDQPIPQTAVILISTMFTSFVLAFAVGKLVLSLASPVLTQVADVDVESGRVTIVPERVWNLLSKGKCVEVQEPDYPRRTRINLTPDYLNHLNHDRPATGPQELPADNPQTNQTLAPAQGVELGRPPVTYATWYGPQEGSPRGLPDLRPIDHPPPSLGQNPYHPDRYNPPANVRLGPEVVEPVDDRRRQPLQQQPQQPQPPQWQTQHQRRQAPAQPQQPQPLHQPRQPQHQQQPQWHQQHLPRQAPAQPDGRAGFEHSYHQTQNHPDSLRSNPVVAPREAQEDNTNNIGVNFVRTDIPRLGQANPSPSVFPPVHEKAECHTHPRQGTFKSCTCDDCRREYRFGGLWSDLDDGLSPPPGKVPAQPVRDQNWEMSPGTLPSVAGVSDEKSVYEGAGFGTMRWKMRPLQRLDLVPGRGQVGDGEVSSLSSWEGGVRDDESEEAVSPCTVTTIPDDEDRRKET